MTFFSISFLPTLPLYLHLLFFLPLACALALSDGFALVLPPPFLPFLIPLAVVLHRGQLLGLRGMFRAICRPLILSLFTSSIFFSHLHSSNHSILISCILCSVMVYIRTFLHDCYLFSGCFFLFCHHKCAVVCVCTWGFFFFYMSIHNFLYRSSLLTSLLFHLLLMLLSYSALWRAWMTDCPFHLKVEFVIFKMCL